MCLTQSAFKKQPSCLAIAAGHVISLDVEKSKDFAGILRVSSRFSRQKREFSITAVANESQLIGAYHPRRDWPLFSGRVYRVSRERSRTYRCRYHSRISRDLSSLILIDARGSRGSRKSASRGLHVSRCVLENVLVIRQNFSKFDSPLDRFSDRQSSLLSRRELISW